MRRCGVGLSGAFDTDFEQSKRRCANLVSQLRCPHHYKTAKVEMVGENFDDLSLEVVACCDEFRRRVEEALESLMTHGV